MLKLHYQTPLLVTVLALLVAGCSDESTAPTPTPATSVVNKTNVRPDSVDAWLYYSLDGDSVVPVGQAATDRWDIRFAYLQGEGRTRTVDLQLNSGTVGAGDTRGFVDNRRFDDVTSIGATSAYMADDTAAARRVIPNCVACPSAVFVYDPSKHTINAAPDRTVLIRSRGGAYYKFQVTSIYKDAVAMPDLFTPIGYYTFRYRRANDGGTF